MTAVAWPGQGFGVGGEKDADSGAIRRLTQQALLRDWPVVGGSGGGEHDSEVISGDVSAG